MEKMRRFGVIRAAVGLICAALVVSAGLFLIIPDSTRDVEQDGVVFHDLSRLFSGILLYADQHEGRVPALRIGNDVPESAFRTLADSGLSADVLCEINSRRWEYVVPEVMVGKQLEGMEADDVLIIAKANDGEFHLETTGRAFRVRPAVR